MKVIGISFAKSSKMQHKIQEIRNTVKHCTKCKDLVKSRKQAVPGYGFADAKIFFVGLAPGRLGADSTGIPFTKDSSGKLFQQALSSSGICMEPNGILQNDSELQAYVTNLVKCNPKNEKGNNRYPSKLEVENCKDFLRDEMSLINFDVIVPLGRLATEMILNRKCSNFTSMHNKLIKINDMCCIPFIHPSYIVRGAYPKDKYLEDFKTLRNWVLDLNK